MRTIVVRQHPVLLLPHLNPLTALPAIPATIPHFDAAVPGNDEDRVLCEATTPVLAEAV